jgi:predicted ATPase
MGRRLWRLLIKAGLGLDGGKKSGSRSSRLFRRSLRDEKVRSDRSRSDVIKVILNLCILGAPTSVNVYGRKVKVPWAVDKVARFTFADLCEQALGTADYITLASNFETIIIDQAPYMYLRHKNQARRLINLVDALCEFRLVFGIPLRDLPT